MNVALLLAQLAARPSGTAMLVGDADRFDGPALALAIDRFAITLRESGARVLATCTDNGPAWVIADLAALAAGIVHVPLPSFFTDLQRAHVVASAGVDAILAPVSMSMPGFGTRAVSVGSTALALGCRDVAPVSMPANTAKITFTSGTTGTPKGVCLSAAGMFAVAQSLVDAMADIPARRHLCALPLAILLENIAGVLVPLMRGDTVIVPPLAQVGLAGSSQFDPGRLDACMHGHAADNAIVLPQMLRAWTAWRVQQHGTQAAPRFVAVGGAPAGETLLAQARAAGLPAYEGYGLSEGVSVQTLNLPGAQRVGSVGRALPHARLRVSADGEIEIGGSLMLGYLGDPSPMSEWWPTGDLGSIDADGCVHVHGRRKNVLITGFGRNVSPEWVESILCAQPAIAQAVVVGDGWPALAAIVWPRSDGVEDIALDSAIAAANAALPDYARLGGYVRATMPFTSGSGACTPNGRPLRPAIAHHHADALFHCHERIFDVVS